MTEVGAVKVQERKANLDELWTAQGRCALSVGCVVCSHVRATRRQVFVQDTPQTHFLRHEDSPTAFLVESSVVTSHVAARGCIFPVSLGRIFCNHGVPVACTSGESNNMLRGLEPFVEACCSLAGGGYLANPLLVSGRCRCRAPRHAPRAQGKTQLMNAIAAEIAIRLECARVLLGREHFQETLNIQCDALSRISEGANIPSCVSEARCDTRETRSAFILLGVAATISVQSRV